MGQHCEILQAKPVPGACCTHASFTQVWAGSHTSGGQSHKKHLGTVSLLSTGISKWLKPTLEVKAMVKWMHFFAIIYFGSTSISMADTEGQYIAKEGIRDCL